MENIGEKSIYSRRKNKEGDKITCDSCIFFHLFNSFKNWSSGNEFIDNLLRRCQLEQLLKPENIVEWVPYENFEDVKYETKGGFGSIYSATWIVGWISGWDNTNKQFIRIGKKKGCIEIIK
ncbi:hypothetical protein C2G38_2027493 [Gigaspora rosea]|uniref:Protein kinase domain-containing protein n=1 Tax=Gigaspora rosea TaxID=44941 RepID=A0A397W805_9GLOM|nr:hypothetical protein C2G38_2027493 [Gigaspora rosea]